MSVEGSARLKVWFILGGWALSIGLGLLIVSGRALAADDYPTAWQGPMDSTLDSWGYYNRECVSFVAWRLHNTNGFEMPRAIGNASNWGLWANNHGYSVNMNPAVGSVAWFSNHVAWVEKVSGTSVTIEDYNGVDSNHNGTFGDDGTYNERTVMANSANGYIHFKDLSAAEASGVGVAGMTFMGSERLDAGQPLRVNQYILSADARFFSVMQGDGNLVLYGPSGRAYWSSATSGSGAAYALMQSDGNLVLYRADNTPVWSSRTTGRGSSSLVVQNDGNLVIYSPAGASWASNTSGYQAWSYYGSLILNTNKSLGLNQYLRSNSKKYALALQGDGNLVLYTPGYHVIWSTSTSNLGVTNALMQGDGNFVLYASNWRPIWATNVSAQSPSFLSLQDDGNLVTYTVNGSSTWSTNTAGRI